MVSPAIRHYLCKDSLVPATEDCPNGRGEPNLQGEENWLLSEGNNYGQG